MKRSLMSRSLLAFVLFAAMTVSAHAQKFSSAHWKSKSVVEGGNQGEMTAEGEIWLKNEKMYLKSQMSGMKTHMIVGQDSIYQWIEGQPTGMKIPKSMQAGKASADYVNMDLQTKGKKTGTETLDGLVCDVYVLETNEGGQKAKHTGWLARTKSGFPVKWVMETGNNKTTTTNRDIEIPASVADSLLTPPKDVDFQDLSEMMKNVPKQ